MIEDGNNPGQREVMKDHVLWLARRLEEYDISDDPQQNPPTADLELILEATSYTKPFRDFLLDSLRLDQDATTILESFKVDLRNDQLGIFEPGNEHEMEKGYLKNALSAGLDLPREFENSGTTAFNSVFSSVSSSLPYLVSWADKFRESYEDDSFTKLVDQLRPYLPPPPKLN